VVPGGLQQAAYQPSGNGISGQIIPLSFVAFGASWTTGSGSEGAKSSCGAGSIAILTASRIRSNSASLITLSHVRERMVSKVFWLPIERIAQIVSIERFRLYLVNDRLFDGGAG
jgi:hypothetical protein